MSLSWEATWANNDLLSLYIVLRTSTLFFTPSYCSWLIAPLDNARFKPAIKDSYSPDAMYGIIDVSSFVLDCTNPPIPPIIAPIPASSTACFQVSASVTSVPNFPFPTSASLFAINLS